MAPGPPHFRRVAAWRRVGPLPGLAVATLAPVAGGWQAAGHEVLADASAAWSSRFVVSLDSQWRTRDVDVEVIGEHGLRRLRLAATADARWTRDGRAVPELTGCLDVDVAATPLTNTFPIRRLRLEVDRSVEILAAWIDVPTLALEPVRQRYTRLADEAGHAVYRYQDDRPGGGRPYRLVVDDAGVVVEYDDFAVRL